MVELADFLFLYFFFPENWFVLISSLTFFSNLNVLRSKKEKAFFWFIPFCTMDTAVLPKLLENLISPNEHLRFPATVLFEELRKEPEKTICCLMEVANDQRQRHNVSLHPAPPTTRFNFFFRTGSPIGGSTREATAHRGGVQELVLAVRRVSDAHQAAPADPAPHRKGRSRAGVRGDRCGTPRRQQRRQGRVAGAPPCRRRAGVLARPVPADCRAPRGRGDRRDGWLHSARADRGSVEADAHRSAGRAAEPGGTPPCCVSGERGLHQARQPFSGALC